MSSLFFRDQGTGRPLVFLHGFCDTGEVWSDFVKPLISSFRVITPDLPGFGQSALPADRFTIDEVGEAVNHWMEKCHLDKPIVIGHSLGGYVALSLLARHPNLLSGIGLFHSTPYADSEERRKAREKIVEFVQRNGVTPFIESFIPGLFHDQGNPNITPALARAASTKPETLIAYTLAMRNRPDHSETFIHSQIPLMVIAGTDDPLISVEGLQILAKKTKKCLFHELPKTAHMGIFEAEKQCQTIISTFADGVFSGYLI